MDIRFLLKNNHKIGLGLVDVIFEQPPSGLTQIGVAKTKLSSEGQAMIIKSMKHLVLLLRGDFLCDALGKYHNVWSFK